MHVPAGHRFPDATGVAFASAWARHRCLQLYLLGTEHRWCEDPIESALFIIRDRAPMVQRTLLNLLRLLLLGTEHRWCEDPIESAPFIIIIIIILLLLQT